MRVSYTVVSVLVVLLSACQVPEKQNATVEPLPSARDAVGDCVLSGTDAAWVDQAMANWTFARRKYLAAPDLQNVEALFFSNDCQLNSKTIMTSAEKTPWRSSLHNGAVTLPDGDTMPPVVTSFSSGNDEGGFFVMSTPSVWEAGGVKSDMGLEILMYAVMLHEGAHVLQIPTYGIVIGDLVETYDLPDDFNDDSLQELFEGNVEYAAGVKAETEIFMQAAAAATDEEAKRLITQALNMIEVRRDQWLVGDYAKYRYANDVWLTLEGSGQWIGYAWLVDPEGAGVDHQTAVDEWGLRSKFWTQNEGFAMALALDRLDDDWKETLFRRGDKTINELLLAATE